jgi:hypothetical protein
MAELASCLSASKLGYEGGADLLAVGVALLTDLPVEAFAIVAAFVPAPHQVGYVGVEDAGTPVVGGARRRLF